MMRGLADEWCSKVRDLPQENPERLAAARYQAHVLRSHGKYTDAETMLREEIAMMRQALGPDHEATLAVTHDLATTLDGQNKFAESEAMHRDVMNTRRRVLGPEHVHMLLSAVKMAVTMNNQGKHTDAETVLREGFCGVSSRTRPRAPRYT